MRQRTRSGLSSPCTLNPASPACGSRRLGPTHPFKASYTHGMGKRGGGLKGKTRGGAASLGFRKGLNLINSTEHSVELSVCGLTSASPPPFTDDSTNESDFHATLCFLALPAPYAATQPPRFLYRLPLILGWLVVRFLWTYVRGVICMTARRMDCDSRTNEKVFA